MYDPTMLGQLSAGPLPFSVHVPREPEPAPVEETGPEAEDTFRAPVIPGTSLRGFLALYRAGFVDVDLETGHVFRLVTRLRGRDDWVKLSARRRIDYSWAMNGRMQMRVEFVANGQRLATPAHLLVYSVAHDCIAPRGRIRFRDGDYTNCAASNLYLHEGVIKRPRKPKPATPCACCATPFVPFRRADPRMLPYCTPCLDSTRNTARLRKRAATGEYGCASPEAVLACLEERRVRLAKRVAS